MCPFLSPPECGRAEDRHAVSVEVTEGERQTERVVRGYESGAVGCVKMGGRCSCCLPIRAVLVGGGGVGVDRGAVWQLAIFARRHPLVYPVQAACLLKVTNLPRGREALNG